MLVGHYNLTYSKAPVLHQCGILADIPITDYRWLIQADVNNQSDIL